MARVVNVRYAQRQRFNRERLFEIFNDCYLRVRKKSRRRQHDYVIDLVALEPRSKREHRIPWHWLGLALLSLAVLPGLAYYLASRFSLDVALYVVPLSLLALALALGFSYLFMYRFERTRVFFSRYAAFPVVEILVGNPDRPRYLAFVRELETRVKEEIQKRQLPPETLQAGEVRMLRRLTHKGLLNRDQYEQAKLRIFEQLG